VIAVYSIAAESSRPTQVDFGLSGAPITGGRSGGERVEDLAELACTLLRKAGPRPDLDRKWRSRWTAPAPPSRLVAGEPPSIYACPDCDGTLFQLHDRTPERFRCHTGHAFIAQSLLAAVRDKSEDAVWNAVRNLHEHASLLRHLAEDHTADKPELAARLRAECENIMRRSLVVQSALAQALATGEGD
jgi:two-component system chemotaxis response regulator CheB